MYRERKNLTQNDLARYLNVSPQAIHKYEHGVVCNIPLDKIEELANVLDVPPGILVGWQNDPNNDPNEEAESRSNMYDFTPILARLKDAKARSGMTNEQLSAKSGIPAGTLNKLLSGDTREPKLPAIISIAEALGVSVDYIVYGRSNPTPAASSSLDETLLRSFHQLNEDGQQKVVTYAEDLVSSGKYEPASPRKVV